MSNDLPAHMRPERSFQGLILTLQRFWADQGCVILQPYDMEVGAGTFHPATTLRALGPKPWSAAYVQPSRRPKDGRYGENPNRLQHYYQFQVILKPSPDDIQELYLKSLVAIGIDPKLHDIRFVEDDWEARRSAPGASAGSAGATAWRSRSSPTSSRSRASNARRSPASSPTASNGWPCMCRASTTSTTSTSTAASDDKVTYGDVFLQDEQEYSRHNFEDADTDMLFAHFKTAEAECRFLHAGWRNGGRDRAPPDGAARL